MEEQVRRNGVWSGDIAQPEVARVFFELPDGTYHPGMFVASLQDAMRLVLEYGLTVPRSFVTLGDEVVLDVLEGKLDFPKESQALFDDHKGRFPSRSTRWLEPDNLGRWARSRCARLVNAAQAHAKASGFDGSAPEAYDHPVNRLEHELQSVAARFGLDLYRFGYQVPGVVCAELECFGTDRSESDPPGTRPQAEAGLWENDVGGEPQGEFRFEAASVQDRQGCLAAGAANGTEVAIPSKPPIARIWWGVLALVLLLMVQPWGGDGFEGSIMRIFTIVIYGSMVPAAMLIYWTLTTFVVPQRSSWVSRNDETLPDGEFDPHTPRGGRIPRSMDPTDPASDGFWMGNRTRDQLFQDDLDRL